MVIIKIRHKTASNKNNPKRVMGDTKERRKLGEKHALAKIVFSEFVANRYNKVMGPGSETVGVLFDRRQEGVKNMEFVPGDSLKQSLISLSAKGLKIQRGTIADPPFNSPAIINRLYITGYILGLWLELTDFRFVLAS